MAVWATTPTLTLTRARAEMAVWVTTPTPTLTLARAEMAVWLTTAPIAETRACCKSEQYNYSQVSEAVGKLGARSQ